MKKLLITCFMKKLLITCLMILGIVLLPSFLHAPSTDGQILAQSTSAIQNPTTNTIATIDTTAKLTLQTPFNTASQWANGDKSLNGILWDTNHGQKYFAIQDGKFISTDPTDTWFVYGWFGSLAAIRESYNIKYPEWQNRHNGIDFAGREGIDVTSASIGEVIFAGKKIGNTVIIKNDDYQITYGHLQDITVTVGQQMTTGDLIGHLGKTGTTNPHLHFQLDRITSHTRLAVNPVPLLTLDWDTTLIPITPSNSFYAGSADPAQQPNFTW